MLKRNDVLADSLVDLKEALGVAGDPVKDSAVFGILGRIYDSGHEAGVNDERDRAADTLRRMIERGA